MKGAPDPVPVDDPHAPLAEEGGELVLAVDGVADVERVHLCAWA